MLTTGQKRKLETRGELSPEEKKFNEFAVRRSTRRWLDGADDFVFVSDRLPEKQLLKIISNPDLKKLSEAMIKALHVVGTPHIIEEKYVTDGVIPIHEKTDLLTRPGPVRGFKQTLRPASPEELERAQLIREHIAELFNCLGEADLRELRNEIKEILEVS